MSVSLLISNVKVTGSPIIYNANFTGIGGAQVFVSGNLVFISGGAGGGAGTGDVTLGQLNALSGFVTGISGYLQDQINNISGGGNVTGTTTIVNGLTGNINITGAGGVTVSTVGQNIIVSGREAGDFLTFITPIPTGIDSYFIEFPNTIYATPPVVNFTLETKQPNFGYSAAISGRSISGFWALFSDIVLEDQLFLNTFVQQSTSSSINFITGLGTGFDKYLITYPNTVFTTVPYIIITQELSGSANFYGAVISGKTVNDFYILTSDIITDSGVYFNVFAKN